MADVKTASQKTGKQTGDTTSRKCFAKVHNLWGETLEYVILRHLRGNDPNKRDEHKWTDVKDGEYTEPQMDINYETGLGADGDYWFVKFKTQDKGEIFVSKGNFFCDLTADDQNDLTIAEIIAPNELKIIPHISSNCTTDSIHKEE
jgi:hypothetical protein